MRTPTPMNYQSSKISPTCFRIKRNGSKNRFCGRRRTRSGRRNDGGGWHNGARLYDVHTIDDLIYIIDNSGAVELSPNPKTDRAAMAAAKQCPCCHFVVHMDEFHEVPEEPSFHV